MGDGGLRLASLSLHRHRRKSTIRIPAHQTARMNMSPSNQSGNSKILIRLVDNINVSREINGLFCDRLQLSLGLAAFFGEPVPRLTKLVKKQGVGGKLTPDQL